ncbi:MAG: tetrahydrofolate dehydrogenase/cyclohydrolase catalytic domain-containing protein, partial [Burkholderiaceae bacterium]
MSAKMIDGKALAASVRESLKPRIEQLADLGHRPGLAVILVGDNPASAVYVRNKVKACEDAGIRSVLERLPASTTEAELLARIESLNADPAIHGILVQLPLPQQIDEHKVIETI